MNELQLSNTPAKHFGVVITSATGKVKSVFNPDYDWQLALHKYDTDCEELRIFLKEEFEVGLESNAMDPAIVYKIVSIIEKQVGKK